MVAQIAGKPDQVRLIAGSCMVEGESQFSLVSVVCVFMHVCKHMYTNTHVSIVL